MAVSHPSHTLCQVDSRSQQGDREKMSRNTLQVLSPNICLPRLNIASELTKTGGSVNVRHINNESPLRRKLLTRRALNASHRPSHGDDSTAVSKSKRHNASKTSSTCRCFGRPMVCSICVTRSVLSTCDC